MALLTACGGDGASSQAGTDGSSSTGFADGSGGATGTSTGQPEPGEPPPPLPDTQQCRFGGWAPGLLPDVVFTSVVETGVSSWTAFALEPDADVAWLGDAAGGVTRLDIASGVAELIVPGPLDSAVHGLAILDDVLVVRWQGTGSSPAVTVERFVYDETTGAVGQGLRVVRIPLASGRAGQGLAFDDAGMLLVPLGDMEEGELEGPSHDVSERAGNLLRLDVRDQVADYEPTLPKDNPWADDKEGSAAEAWAYGLRDPAGCSTDPVTGALWCVDRGEESSEATRVSSGNNLGWPWMDGNTCRVPSGECFQLDVVAPDVVTPQGCGAVTGAVAADDALLEGAFVYGDRCSGEIWAHRPRTDVPSVTHRVAVWDAGPVGFARDGAGVVWALDSSGALGRVTSAPSDEVFPVSLRDSGCFGPGGAFAVDAGVVPYEVNAPLWTDGAIKDRAIAMPAGQPLGLDDAGRLRFPVGGVVLKNFSFERDDGDVVPFETRVMVRRDYGWEFHSYRWDADGQDAALLGDGDETALPGGPTHVAGLPYSYPSRNECRYCHGTADPDVIGLRVDQLARQTDYGTGPVDQLEALASIGVLPEVSVDDPVAALGSEDDPLEARARAYLHTNCGHCHRPSGWAPAEIGMDLDAHTPLAETGLCESVRYFVPWFDAEERLVPGDPEASLVWLRASDRGDGQMPPLGTFANDPGAVVLRDWIASMENCE